MIDLPSGPVCFYTHCVFCLSAAEAVSFRAAVSTRAETGARHQISDREWTSLPN